MDLISRNIIPSGILDYNTEYERFKEGNLSTSLNTRIQNDEYGSIIGRELVNGNSFAFYPDTPTASNKRFRIYFDTQKYSAANYTLDLLTPNGATINAATASASSGLSISDAMADFVSSITAQWGSLINITNTITTSANTGYVEFDIDYIAYWDYYINITAGGYITTISTSLFAADPSMVGDFIPVASYDLLGDLFCLFTTIKDLPTPIDILSATNNSGEYLITTATDFPYIDGGKVIIKSESFDANGEWIIKIIAPNQFLLLGSTFVNSFIGGRIIFYPTSLTEFGVGVNNINNGQWTYTRLVRTDKWNIRAAKQPEIGIGEDNLFRKSFYWCDHYNPDRVFYYKGEYIEDGAIKIINADGTYDYDTIGEETKLILTNSGESSIGYVSQTTGGALLSGSYRYTAQFLTDENTEVGFFLEPTFQMPVFSFSGGIPTNATGDESGTLTNKANVLFITHPKNTFKYIQLIAIYYTGGTISAEIVNKVAIAEESTQTTISHTGLESNAVFFDIGLVVGRNIVWDICKTMRAINNRNTRSNLKSSQAIYDLTEFFKTFKHQVKAKIIDSVGYTVPPSTNQLTIGDYEVPETVEAYGGFMLNECYRMLGKVQWKNGSYSDCYWIDDILVDLNDYNIDSLYPDNRRVGNEYSASGFGYGFVLGDLTYNKTYIPYLEFLGFDMNFIIDGVPIKNLISRIIVERTEVVREVLQSGFIAMGVNGQQDVASPNFTINSFYYDPALNNFVVPIFSPATQPIYPNPFITGGQLLSFTYPPNPKYTDFDNPVTPGNLGQVRNYGFFYSMDSIITRNYITPLSTDKIIYYGNPTGFFWQFPVTGTNNPPTIGNWNGGTGLLNPSTLDVSHGIIMEGLANSNNLVDGLIVSNNPSITAGIFTFYATIPYQNQPCIALKFTTDAANTSPNDDYGFYMAYYYRPISVYDQNYNPNTSKYGEVANSKGRYLCGTIITEPLSGVVLAGQTVGIYGQDVFTQKTTFKFRTPFAYIDSNSHLAENKSNTPYGFTGAISFWSQNINNAQLIVKNDPINKEWNYPSVIPWEAWCNYQDFNNPVTKPIYDESYSYLPKPATDTIFNKNVNIVALPATIYYSSQKALNSYTDPFRSFQPLNFADLDLTKGEIVHHEIINSQLFAFQKRKFEKREFNSSGRLVLNNTSQVVLGDGTVIPGLGNEISNIGCSNKFSIIKGRSRGGNDIVYWWSDELRTIVRFGYDGTVPISFMHQLEPFVRNNIRWATGKDNPASGEGISGVWNDINKEVIWTVQGYASHVNRNEWNETNEYVFGDLVTYNTYQFVAIKKNEGVVPYYSIGEDNTWIPYNSDEYISIFTNSYTIVYSEIQNGGSGFRSFTPNIYMKWKDKYLSPEKTTGEIYEHEVDPVSRGNFYGVQYDGYDEFVVSAKPFSVEGYGSIRVMSDKEPYKIEFQTNNNSSELNRTEFTFREKWYDAPIKNANFVAPYTFGSKLYGNYIKVCISYLGGEFQRLKGFVIKSKTRSRKSNT
jgi:hypothetical protein